MKPWHHDLRNSQKDRSKNVPIQSLSNKGENVIVALLLYAMYVLGHNYSDTAD